MDQEEKQRLLDACATAQEDYLRAVEGRKRAFAAALRTPISAREIAEVTGVPGSTVSSIVRRR